MQEITVPACRASEVWQLPAGELREAALFHGTCEKIEGPLEGGPYDGVLWTADSPAIAQCYIPSAGAKRGYAAPRGDWELAEPVVPGYGDGPEVMIARLLGYELVIHDRRPDGFASSWSWTGCDRSPKRGEIFAYVRDVLGYTADAHGSIWLKTRHEPGGPGETQGTDHIMPADWKMAGTLFVLLPQAPLRILDIAAEGEGDLTDPQYHRLREFRAAAASGYDGVRIHDWAQSEIGGNVGHYSIGLFPAGIAKTRAHAFPAVRHDWGEDLRVTDTEEFRAGHRAAVEAAYAAGERVPRDVLAAYGLKARKQGAAR